MTRTVKLLLVLNAVSLATAFTAIGCIVWMNENPAYWFTSLAGQKGPQGDEGPRGDPGPVGPQGPVGPDVSVPPPRGSNRPTTAPRDQWRE